MTGKSKDSDGEEKGQQFTPTDWDWVMFLSGEINAIETRFDTVWTASIAVMMACIGFIIGLTFRITYPGSSDSILDSTSSTNVIFVGVVIIGLAYCIFLITKGKKRETKKRVKPLEKCREDIFSRLGDPNKINDPNKTLECYLNAVGKKGDKNK